MKTAMQELIDKVEQAISYNVEGRLVEKYTWTELFNDMELALEKEKWQIQNVFEHCWNHPNWKGEYDIKDMEDYLKNYNLNK